MKKFLPILGGSNKPLIAKADLRSMEEIVEHYSATSRISAAAELRYFARQKTLAEAVSGAALAVGPDGKKLKHQWRIPPRILKAASSRLRSNLSALSTSRNFADLHARVASLIGNIRGVGELMIYDTALRIGAKLELDPDLVYLHAGTRKGARVFGIGRGVRAVSPSAFPTVLRQLKPREIEDVLCIYKDQLRGILSNTSGKVTRRLTIG